MQKQELLGLTVPELERLLADLGEPPYRGKQLYHALYHERQWDLGKVTPFPAALRARLSERFQVTLPETEKTFDSRDGTRRTLFRLADGCKIETVRMPEPGRDTICVSTQVGCPVDCKFCLTGVMGFTRNLTAGEIVGQVLRVMDLRVMETNPLEARQRFNLVFMGMGEPLLNFDNVMAALKLRTQSPPSVRRIPWLPVSSMSKPTILVAVKLLVAATVGAGGVRGPKLMLSK